MVVILIENAIHSDILFKCPKCNIFEGITQRECLMLFQVFRHIYTAEELDSHAKYDQSLKKWIRTYDGEFLCQRKPLLQGLCPPFSSRKSGCSHLKILWVKLPFCCLIIYQCVLP